jgi:hypothetical protein
MAENTGIETIHDDDLGDEALDRSSGAKMTSPVPCNFSSPSLPSLLSGR